MSKVTGEMNVAKCLKNYPTTLNVFLRYFKPMANPVLRETMTPLITIGRAASLHGHNLEKLLAELNQAAEDGGAAAGPSAANHEPATHQ